MKVVFYLRRLTMGGCQLNALHLANAMVNKVDQLVWVSDEGELKEKLNPQINFIHDHVASTRHPSNRSIQLLKKIVDEMKIDVVLAFDPILSLEAYALSFCTSAKVFGYITAQATPKFYYPKSWPVYFVNNDTRNRYETAFGESSLRKLTRQRINIDSYCPKAIDETIKKSIFQIDSIPENQEVHTLITRVSSGKEMTIRYFINFAKYYNNKHENSIFFIIGSGDKFNTFKQEILGKSLDNIVIMLGQKSDIIPYMQASTVVYGMASSIQQALCCGTKCVVLGDKGYAALVSENNVDEFDNFHFNLHTRAKTTFEDLTNSLVSKGMNNSWERDYARQKYDITQGVEWFLNDWKVTNSNGSRLEYYYSYCYYYFKKLLNKL